MFCKTSRFALSAPCWRLRKASLFGQTVSGVSACMKLSFRSCLFSARDFDVDTKEPAILKTDAQVKICLTVARRGSARRFPVLVSTEFNIPMNIVSYCGQESTSRRKAKVKLVSVAHRRGANGLPLWDIEELVSPLIWS